MNDLYKINSITISKLFNEYFIVCENDVQRDFIWNKEDCITLLDDILNEKEIYYGINSMGFSYIDEYSRKIECYDGQQRLTTYSLLMLALHFFVNDNIDDNNPVKTAILIRLKNLLIKNDDLYKKNLIFIPNDGNNDNKKIFENIIKIDKYNEYNEYIIKNNFQKNKYAIIIKSFFEKFEEILDNVDIFYNKLNIHYQKRIDGEGGLIDDDETKFISLINSIIMKPAIL
jgi:uncharacterized protein with ParB-like and HNH nuclease domain